MTATGHAVIGTVIAAKFGNPALAVPIALFSHIAADLFPHWDTGTHAKTKTKTEFVAQTITDVSFGFILSFIIIVLFFPQTSLIYTYFIVLTAQFFDWATAPYLFMGVKSPPIFEWFYKFQKRFDNRLDKPWGIIGQAAVLVALVLVAKFF